MRAPRNEAEKRAAVLLDQAAGAAKRGDYKAATAALDQAEAAAPRWALVHQYRSNVAYLMGCVAGAEKAQALALQSMRRSAWRGTWGAH